MNRRLPIRRIPLATLIALLALSGCATTDRRTVQDSTPDGALDSGGAPYRHSAAKNLIETISDPDVDRKTLGEAADTAGYFKEKECLPALERRLAIDEDWFARYACANAVDSIDEASSRPAVISALDREPNGMVAMLLAMYLSRYPDSSLVPLLERKRGEFAAKGTDADLLACVFLEDALEKSNNGQK